MLLRFETEEDPDVKPYIQNVTTIWKDVDLPAELLEILKIFENMIKPIYKSLKDEELINSADAGQVSRRDLLAAQKTLIIKSPKVDREMILLSYSI